jgi:hypothetical protein
MIASVSPLHFNHPETYSCTTIVSITVLQKGKHHWNLQLQSVSLCFCYCQKRGRIAKYKSETLPYSRLIATLNNPIRST